MFFWYLPYLWSGSVEIQPTAFSIPLSTKLQNTELQEMSEVANALIVPLNYKFKTTSFLEDAEAE